MTTWLVLLALGGVAVFALWLGFRRMAGKPAQGARHPHLEILVIDDNIYVLDVIRLGLEQAGYKVHTDSTGKKGIEFFQQHSKNISVVLLDYSMPEMSGAEVFDHLQEFDASVPVILITGFCDDAKKCERLTKNVAGFLVKPFQIQQLLGTVRKVISHAQKQLKVTAG